MDTYFRAEVLAAARTSAHLVRLTLGGEGMTAFASTGAPDEWVRVFLPRSGESGVALPVSGGAGSRWDQPVPPARLVTVRAWDAERTRLTVEVVVHEQGPLSDWAETCASRPRAMSEVVVSAPRGSFVLPDETAWVLLAGDLTALPAIRRIVESLPSGVRSRALVEMPPDCAEDLPAAGETVRAAHTPSAHAPSRLADAVRSLPWPPGPTYVWMAGEAGQMRAVRRQLRHERHLPAASYDVMGYWRADAERWQARYAAAHIDTAALWAEGVRAGKDPEEIWDAYDAALDREGL